MTRALAAGAVLALASAALPHLARDAGPEAPLLAADASFDAALAARDPGTFAAHVAEDAVFAAGTPLVGRAAVAAHWSRYLAPDGPTLRWRPIAGGVAPSGDLGWTTGEARYAWKQKGIDQSGLRYVTVWRRSAGGRWEAVLDGSLEPVPPGPSTRAPVRTFASSDGFLEGTIGTYRRDEGTRTITGIFLVVRERRDGAWRTIHDSEMPTG